ncbi:hypothetical protein EDB65_102269 [Vibrio crassostreae]|uniref:hypothetical protein n=1 Tax=Vibrio crassostreae TaxID=246167 RepID=UPI00105304E8|nr:hypothetical protein [Vibrio crassostreae]TCN88482.1 hypothetical protein EDB65_102269 [Vibrio crassostreae]
MNISHFLCVILTKIEDDQRTIVTRLNLYHHEFSTLDEVTFNRWVHAKTVPSVKRQILLCEFFNMNRIEFFNEYLEFKRHKKLKGHLVKFYEKLESSAFNLHAGVANYNNYCRERLSMVDYRKKFRNNVVVQPIHSYIDDHLNVEHVNIVHNQVNEIDFHYSFACYFKCTNDIAFGLNVKPDKINKTTFYFPLARNFNYESSQSIYKSLLCGLLNESEIFESSLIKATMNSENYHLFSMLGFELLTVVEINKCKIYYMKVDALDFFSNSLILDIVVD